jgi:hypothetical protein
MAVLAVSVLAVSVLAVSVLAVSVIVGLTFYLIDYDILILKKYYDTKNNINQFFKI